MEDITKEVFKALSTFVNEEKRLLLPRFSRPGKENTAREINL